MFNLLFFISGTYALSYWNIVDNGFLPQFKGNSCMYKDLNPLCKTMFTNPTTENIIYSLDNLNIYDVLNSNESVIEDTFHWLSVATCRIGYNQNPTGGSTENPIKIPYVLGNKLLSLASYLHREPTTGYASLVLDNCEILSYKDEDIYNYDNYIIQRTVTSESEEFAHRTEKGFYASHCAVEYSLGSAIKNLLELSDIENHNDDNIVKTLRKISYNIRKAIPVLKHMRHFFNSEHFFRYLRSFVKCGNIGDNGIVFEGPDECINIILPNGTTREIQYGKTIYGFRGPTGAQTSSLPSIDSALQITTSISSDPNLELTMKEFRQYHPLQHYELNNMLEKLHLRDTIIKLDNPLLTDAYNDAVTAVAEFRFAHVDHVMTYIFRSIPHVPAKYVTGTGNTPVATYLCKSAIGTLMSRITEKASNNLPTVSIPQICFHECETNSLDVHDKYYCELFYKSQL